MRVAVALSGGIDSAVAALLLQRQGLLVDGVHMHNWDASVESSTAAACSEGADYKSAQRVAAVLQMPLRRVSFVRRYWHSVFERVLRGYREGATPNPDVMCNREIKFGSLWRWAQQQGFSRLATGHYARIVEHDGRPYVGQAADLHKDQSYFLADVPRDVLPSAMFPLGHLPSKAVVREIAAQSGLSFLLEREESMGLCFVGKRRRFGAFLSDFMTSSPGDIIDIDTGATLGKHGGVENYTIGQNVGVGGMPSRLYVVKKSQRDATIHVSANKEHLLLRPTGIVMRTDHAVAAGDGLLLSIRSSEKRGTPVESIQAIISGDKERKDEMAGEIGGEYFYQINTIRPLIAPAPGQVAVLYKEIESGHRIVYSSGIIC